jgi:hypothetical protein
MLHLNLLENQEQASLRTRRRIEIIKINKIETKKIQRMNETKSWSFEKINKIERSLANLTK